MAAKKKQPPRLVDVFRIMSDANIAADQLWQQAPHHVRRFFPNLIIADGQICLGGDGDYGSPGEVLVAALWLVSQLSGFDHE